MNARVFFIDFRHPVYDEPFSGGSTVGAIIFPYLNPASGPAVEKVMWPLAKLEVVRKLKFHFSLQTDK